MIKETQRVIFVALVAFQSVTVFGQTTAAEASDLKRGKLLYIQCRACHELKADQPHKVGPNLAGLLGSKGASAEGFAYSSALRAANLTWDLKTLDRWLEKPSAVVPGNAMAFSGIANPKDRASLLAYIVSETTTKQTRVIANVAGRWMGRLQRGKDGVRRTVGPPEKVAEVIAAV